MFFVCLFVWSGLSVPQSCLLLQGRDWKSMGISPSCPGRIPSAGTSSSTLFSGALARSLSSSGMCLLTILGRLLS